MSKFYDYNSDKIFLDESFMFIQVLDSSRLKENSKKLSQFEYLKRAINESFQLESRHKVTYRIFPMSLAENFEKPMKMIIDTIHTFTK